MPQAHIKYIGIILYGRRDHDAIYTRENVTACSTHTQNDVGTKLLLTQISVVEIGYGGWVLPGLILHEYYFLKIFFQRIVFISWVFRFQSIRSWGYIGEGKALLRCEYSYKAREEVPAPAVPFQTSEWAYYYTSDFVQALARCFININFYMNLLK